LLHYATLAQETNVELFSLSCELIAASKRDTEWRALAAQVRTVFHGLLTDAANWGYLNATGGEETNKTSVLILFVLSFVVSVVLCC
jgi:hypothetical protein